MKIGNQTVIYNKSDFRLMFRHQDGVVVICGTRYFYFLVTQKMNRL